MSKAEELRCSRAEELLFEGIDSPELQLHLESCSSCHQLALRLEASETPSAEWTGSLLDRLAGGACERAEDLIFGEASAEEASLLEEHVLHCEACSALQQADALAVRCLPSLATLEPDASFTHAVLRKTSAAAKRPRRVLRADRFRRYLQRPQAPVEIAYAFAVVVVLLMAPAGAPLSGAPEALMRWLRAEEQGGPRGAGWAELTLVPAASLPAQAVEKGAEWSQTLGGGISLRANQVSWAADALGGHALDFGSALTEREWEELRPVMGEMRCDMHLILRGVRGRLKSPDERC
jgi:hypothetical protein